MTIDFYSIDRNSKLGGEFIDLATTLRRAVERAGDIELAIA